MESFPKIEEKILEFWEKEKIFEKTLEKKSPKGNYVFYDGPPFATGLPHYGHILSSVIKDVVPRYWTMKGYHVRRRWGWDCHGLPIENLIEKELKISGKKQIEELGIDKFNEACRSKVLTYTHEWKKMINRIGRWVEFDNAYKTMDSTYMESVWWALKSIWDKGLIYEGRKVLMYCPRCETPVSKAEVAMDNSYKDVSEEALTVKFKIKNPEKYKLPPNTYVLAWTTTPWTLPGNVALAIGLTMDYVLCSIESNENELVIVAKERADAVLGTKKYTIKKELKGRDLVGVEYEPLFDIPAVRETGKKAWYITAADFVTTEEGTGVVHTAVIYGEDDYNLGLKIDLPMVPLLDEKGHFNDLAPELIKGQYFKKTEKTIRENLEKSGLLFSRARHVHSYPHCWRCETQLFYNAIPAWFINIQKIKQRLIELNEKINWYPEHLKHGRFLNILETAPDWNISRNRYWATPLPFWKCSKERCNSVVCIGSVAELKQKAINFNEVYKTDKIEEIDLHKYLVDKIKLKCNQCGEEMARIPEVIDCWVESGSMPFAEFHYPFENQETFEKRFPSQYIAEYIAQTRAWFYYMHAVATLLFNNISFENCVTTGTILNEKGEKLSKSKMNYTDPWEIIKQYGADSLRYYLMTSVVMEADDLLFNDREVKEVYNKVINILWNVVEFYKMYADEAPTSKTKILKSVNVLDKWILAKMQLLVEEVTRNMDNYNTVKAGRPIKDFIDELSTWYLRRSRERFKGSAGAVILSLSKDLSEADKKQALQTLRYILEELAKILAPFTPFIAEKIYQDIGGKKESVHLADWPKTEKKLIDKKLLEKMDLVRTIVEAGLAARASAGIKVRQPLESYSTSLVKKLDKELIELIKDELNVKEIKFGQDELDTKITPKLKQEGLLRELVRQINALRKEMGLTIKDRIEIIYETGDQELKEVIKKFSQELARSVLADKIGAGEGEKVVKIEERKIKITLVK